MEKNISTLIIHPHDPSTLFLKTIYESIPNKTLVDGFVTKDELWSMVDSHDRVMMMGHGSPLGLFSVGQFYGVHPSGYIIDHTFVELLRKKTNNVFIWCNADIFVERFELEGFYTGMFISEVDEATYCGVFGTDQELIDGSNNGFCNIIAKYINEDKTIIHENVLKEYGEIANQNPVAYYNNLRLYKS